MMILYRNLGVLALIGAVTMGACQSNGAARPAVLEEADSQTMAELKSVLAEAMNRASVEIGPGDPTQTSTIAVLPPRLSVEEDRSVATPTLFDIMIEGPNCYVVRRDTGERYDLEGVSCRAA